MGDLSWDDFHKLQNQLIDLRSANCSLEESSRRQNYELNNLRSQLGILHNDLERAQKSLNSKKKAKDFEHLLTENDRLQQKLVSQEEEFRLQNRTVLQELNQICVTKEKLESELAALKAAGMEGKENPSQSANEALLARLEAENSALRKARSRAAEEHDARVKELRDVVERLTDELNHRKTTGAGDGGTNLTDAERCISPTEDNAGFVHVRDACDGGDGSAKLLAESRQKIEALEQQLRSFDDWVVERDTLVGEKQVFVDRLQGMEDEYQHRMGELEDKCKELQEKLTRKQESYMQLHKEKELVLESGKRELNARNVEMDKLREAYGKLQTQLDQSTARHSEIPALQQKFDEILKASQAKDAKLVAAQEKVQEASAMKMVLESQLAEVKQELEQSKRETEALRRDSAKMRERLANLEQQLNHSTQESWEQQAKLQELIKTAEKRKSLIDEMAKTIQSQNEKHMAEMTTWNDKNLEQIRRLEADLKTRDETIAELRSLVSEIEKERDSGRKLRDRIATLEASLDEHRRTRQAEVAAEKEAHTELVKSHETRIDELRAESAADVASVRAEVEARDGTIKELEVQLDLEKAIVIERDETVDRLKAELADAEERAKLCDKKHRGINKDLKRQLAVERKRAETLQERMAEFLNGERSGAGKNARTSSAAEKSHHGTGHDDACSNGSWSMMSGKSNNNNPTVTSNTTSNNNNSGQVQDRREAFEIGVQTSASQLQNRDGHYSQPVEFVDPLLGETSSSESLHETQSRKSLESSKRSEPATEGGLSTDEIQSLLHRVAQLQQDKWMMEERVRLLEESSSAMTDALLQKSALIQYYCMEGRADARKSGNTSPHHRNFDVFSTPGDSGGKPAVRRIVDFLKASSTTEDQIRGVNKRMQRVVEETLTKNMHLQQNMEELSNEVVVLKERVRGLTAVQQLSK